MSRTLKALIFDNDELARRCISSAFRSVGWSVRESNVIQDPSGLLSAESWDVVVYEIAADKGYGLDFLRQVSTVAPNCKVVVTSVSPSASAALEAITSGAYDYLRKPTDEDFVRLLSRKLTKCFTASSDLSVRPQAREDCLTGRILLGKSKSFIEMIKQVGRVAPTSLPVLLTGESGTGKEVIATTLHGSSNRKDQPFVALNCGAIPSELIESELFGHEKGSFTGAERHRLGLWEEAGGGTIFLDEITETSPAFQVKLLRAIQHGEIRRVGSNRMQQLDVRVIAASNRDVEKEVAAGRFRQDLFYRLNAVSIHLPALRERVEDIPLLIEAFVPRVLHKKNVKFSVEAMGLLFKYPWPGNVRELEHAVIRSVAMCDGTVLPHDLPDHIRNYDRPVTEQYNIEFLCEQNHEWVPLKTVEGEYVARSLAHCNWNKQATARLLNVDRKTLDRMIRRHRIGRPSEGHCTISSQAA